MGCQGALGSQVGLPRRTWMPFWAPTWHPNASPERPKPPILLDSTALFALSQTLPLVLSKCSWTALWQLLAPSWTPLGLILAPLGRILGLTWGLLGAFGAHLGTSWAPLGLHLGLLGKLGASWASIGRQLGARRTPNGRHMDAKWASQVNFKYNCQVGLPQRQPVSTYFLRTPKQLPSPTQLLAISMPLSMDIDGSTLVYIYIYIYILGEDCMIERVKRWLASCGVDRDSRVGKLERRNARRP